MVLTSYEQAQYDAGEWIELARFPADVACLPYAIAHSPVGPEDALEAMTVLLNYIDTTSRFEFWWEQLKRVVLPPLYPVACARVLGTPEKGFRRHCPYALQEAVVQHVSLWLRRSDRRRHMCGSEADLELVIAVLQQALMLPITHARTVREAVEIVARMWLLVRVASRLLSVSSSAVLPSPSIIPRGAHSTCAQNRDRPPVMQQLVQAYIRRFIGYLAGVFRNERGTAPLDAHVTVCREILGVFKRISEEVYEKLEPDSWYVLVWRCDSSCVHRVLRSQGLCSAVGELQFLMGAVVIGNFYCERLRI